MRHWRARAKCAHMRAMPFVREDPANYAHLKRTIDRFLSGFAMRTFFDVGANIGQTSTSIRQLYPDCEIVAFEPVPGTFDALQSNLAGDAKSRAVNIALGAQDGEATMVVKGTSPVNRVVAVPKLDADTVTVKVRRGDDFCTEASIDAISYLKIDTEGHDMEVLRGFETMLARQAVEMVEVEAGLYPGNKRHVPFEQFKAHLEPLNYLLFAIREITHEYSGRANLRRCNMVFASSRLLDANPRERRKRQAQTD